MRFGVLAPLRAQITGHEVQLDGPGHAPRSETLPPRPVCRRCAHPPDAGGPATGAWGTEDRVCAHSPASDRTSSSVLDASTAKESAPSYGADPQLQLTNSPWS